MEKNSTIKRVRDLSEFDKKTINLRWVIMLHKLYDTCMDMEDFYDIYFSDIVFEEEDRKKQVEFLTLLKETLIFMTNTGLLDERDITEFFIMVVADARIDEIMEICIDTSNYTCFYEEIYKVVALIVNGIRKFKPKFVEIIKKQ